MTTKAKAQRTITKPQMIQNVDYLQLIAIATRNDYNVYTTNVCVVPRAHSYPVVTAAMQDIVF